MSVISKDTFRFLKQLKLNNNRPWFEEHRTAYDQARNEFLIFITALADGIRKIEPLPEKEPAKYIKRIYRDIRFSKDKTPYKSHLSAIIERGPEAIRVPLYIHIEPGRSMIGGGVWDPTAEALKKIRQEIDYNGDAIYKIIQAREFKKSFGEISGNKLIRPPKGYETDHPQVELLKFKQLFIERHFEDDLVLSRSLIPEILKSYKTAIPFFHFFDNALGD